MGLFPNTQVTKRIFLIIDTDQSKFVEFEEIIIYLDIMVKGNLKDKIAFIFSFIVFPLDSDFATIENFNNFF